MEEKTGWFVRWLRWWGRWLDDVLVLAGCGLVLVFVYQVWPVGTWLIGGLMLIVVGVLIGRMKAKR